ncbi:hypothetical protein BBP40_003826 [Aspergillus hancockii]|nr:hypothetical protein BBP40_003826 [Aspergillus hancockii]
MTDCHSADGDDHHVYNHPDQIPFAAVDRLGSGRNGFVERVTGTIEPFKNQIYGRKTIRLEEFHPTRDSQLQDINRELGKVKRLSNVHVLPIHMSYEYHDVYAIVTDIADGNLEEYIDDFEPRETLSQWFGCLINAVSFIHSHDILHGSIAPTNILIKNGNILLTDFGFSSMNLREFKTFLKTSASGNTNFKYGAPETVWRPTALPDQTMDVFSLGAVFLEMLIALLAPTCLDRFRSDLDFYHVSAKLDLGRSISFSMGESHKNLWQSTLLRLSERMVDKDRDRRPRASDVYSEWAQLPLSDVPQSPCKCIEHP